MAVHPAAGALATALDPGSGSSGSSPGRAIMEDRPPAPISDGQPLPHLSCHQDGRM